MDLDKVFYDSLSTGYNRQLEKEGKLRGSSDAVKKLAKAAGYKVDEPAPSKEAMPGMDYDDDDKKKKVKEAEASTRSSGDVVKDLFNRAKNG